MKRRWGGHCCGLPAVLHSVQSSPLPSSSTSRSLTLIGCGSLSSKYQNIFGLLKIEVRDKKQWKRRENHNSLRLHVYVLTWGRGWNEQENISSLFTKAFYQWLHNNLALPSGSMTHQKTNPKQLFSPIFWGLSDRQKTDRSIATPFPLWLRKPFSGHVESWY